MCLLPLGLFRRWRATLKGPSSFGSALKAFVVAEAACEVADVAALLT